MADENECLKEELREIKQRHSMDTTVIPTNKCEIEELIKETLSFVQERFVQDTLTKGIINVLEKPLEGQDDFQKTLKKALQ